MRCRWAVRKDIPKSGTNVRAGADHVFPYKGAVLQGTNALAGADAKVARWWQRPAARILSVTRTMRRGAEGSVCFAHIVVPSSQKAVSFARCADESCRRLPPRQQLRRRLFRCLLPKRLLPRCQHPRRLLRKALPAPPERFRRPQPHMRRRAGRWAGARRS